MYDGGKIITGLIVFLGLMTFPLWYNAGAAYKAPELEKPAAEKGKECVEPTEWMQAEHMQLLDEWRDTVVRNAERIYVNAEGKEFNMSLSNTCLDCHSNKTEFCDRCHEYASIEPYCWDCHIDNPKETN